MTACIKTKPKSKRMDGLCITIILTVFDPRERDGEGLEFIKKKRKAWG
jgi:hypothetical protein